MSNMDGSLFERRLRSEALERRQMEWEFRLLERGVGVDEVAKESGRQSRIEEILALAHDNAVVPFLEELGVSRIDELSAIDRKEAQLRKHRWLIDRMARGEGADDE